ncbi:MAG TPA: hypothetical protein VF046_06140 [Gemmatimonadales bacterium]
MRYAPVIPMVALALATACSDTSSNPLETSHEGISAASVHLKGGAHAKPTFYDLGLTLRTTGALSGLGNGDITVELTATGNPTATCGNPGTNTFQAPGRNPAAITLTGVQPIPAGSIINGNVSFDVTTAAPVSPVPGAPECPNSSWEEIITNVAFTSATITVRQPSSVASPGPVVFFVSCTFNPATNDQQPVPGGTVTCS